MAKGKELKYERTHLHFSKEQKVKVVQEIESGQLTRKEAMEKYNIVGHQTLRSWLIQFGTNTEGVARKRYETADQRLAAYKIIAGEATTEEIARQMQIATNTVTGWVRRYKNDVQQEPSLKSNKKSQSPSVDQDKSKLKELEELKLKIASLEMMIDIAEKELKIDIRKKSGTKQ